MAGEPIEAFLDAYTRKCATHGTYPKRNAAFSAEDARTDNIKVQEEIWNQYFGDQKLDRRTSLRFLAWNNNKPPAVFAYNVSTDFKRSEIFRPDWNKSDDWTAESQYQVPKLGLEGNFKFAEWEVTEQAQHQKS